MLLGRHDFIPIDSWALMLVSHEWHKGKPVTAKDVEKRFAKWGSYKGLAFWFWDWKYNGGRMYEHHHEPLASPKVFARRLALNGLIALLLLAFSLAMGIFGYHFLESLSWIDALLNASMILGGMGPVNPLKTEPGKIFASFYAIYSGVILLASVGILITPIFHRFLHRFHLADELDDEK